MRPFSFDPDTGIETIYEDLGDDGVRLHTTQDVEPILEMNKYKANLGREYYAKDSEMWRVASIPNIIVTKWLDEGIDVYNSDHWPRVKKKLNDPEWRFLKTADVRI